MSATLRRAAEAALGIVSEGAFVPVSLAPAAALKLALVVVPGSSPVAVAAILVPAASKAARSAVVELAFAALLAEVRSACYAATMLSAGPMRVTPDLDLPFQYPGTPF